MMSIRDFWHRLTGTEAANLHMARIAAEARAEAAELRARHAAEEHAKAGVERLCGSLDRLMLELEAQGLPKLKAAHVAMETGRDVIHGVRALQDTLSPGYPGYQRLTLLGVSMRLEPDLAPGAITLVPEDPA